MTILILLLSASRTNCFRLHLHQHHARRLFLTSLSSQKSFLSFINTKTRYKKSRKYHCQHDNDDSKKKSPFPSTKSSTQLHMMPLSSSSSFTISQSIIPALWNFGINSMIVVSGIVAVGLGLLYFNQEKLLYIPQIDPDLPKSNSANPPGYQSPVEYPILAQNFHEYYIPTLDEQAKLHSWLFLQNSNDSSSNNSSKSYPTIVVFHGNAGNIGFRLPLAEIMYKELKCNIMLVDYRGYGDSNGTGKPCETGLKVDGESVIKFLQNCNDIIDPSTIFVFGQSLGGAVAFHVAQQWEQQQNQQNLKVILSQQQPPPPPPLAGIIVENTFLSIDDMVDVVFPVLSPIKNMVLRMFWNSKDIVGSIRLPILFLAGELDEIVPHSHMQQLYKISKSSGVSRLSKIHVITNGSHNDSWIQGGSAYWNAFRNFVKEAINVKE